MMDECPQFRRKPRRFPPPIFDQRGRADDERRQRRSISLHPWVRASGAGLQGRHQGEGLQRLAQPHFIGQNPPEFLPIKIPEPGGAEFLVGPENFFQCPSHRSRGQGLERHHGDAH